MGASFAAPKAPPRDYFVPNFGVDHDIKMTELNIGEAEQQHGQSLAVEPAAAPIKRNYFVPNFGVDNEIVATQEHLAQSEKLIGQKMNAESLTPPAPFKNGYFVPNFGMDNEISTSLDNTKQAEAQLKVDWKALQLENTEGSDVMIESDPICSSSGCGQYAHPAPPAGPPMDYPVPSYGKDPDMVGTLNSLSISEKMNNHKLIMGTPESKAKWHNVAKDTLYDYHPALDKDVITTNRNIDAAEDLLGKQMVQLADDPICSSAGCTQYEHPKKKKGYPMNYVVPNFGVDQEIKDHDANIAIVEKELGHVFTPKEAEDGPAKDYKVPNFGVDQDIKDATENISSAESTLGPWTPTQDKNGVWLVPQPIDASSYSYDAGHVDHFV